jgi:hypothetical protein
MQQASSLTNLNGSRSSSSAPTPAMTRSGNRRRSTWPHCRPTVFIVSPRPPPTNRSSTTKPTPPQPARPFTTSSRRYARPNHSPRADRGDRHTRLLGHAAPAVGRSQRAPARLCANRSRQDLVGGRGAPGRHLRERRPAVPHQESERSGTHVTRHGNVGCLPEGSWKH